jgi:hypothetical protein
LISGTARGGTSFGSSVFVRLGIPFWLPGERPLQRTYEHRALKEALLSEDFDEVGRLAREFSDQFPIWGWKLPAIQRYLEMVGQCVPNPHFVILFKEPLSVVARKTAMSEGDVVGKMVDIVAAYQRMVTLVGETKHPCLLVSYDRAVANLEPFIRDAASFAGVSSFDAAAVAAGIREDQGVYLRGWEVGRMVRAERKRTGQGVRHGRLARRRGANVPTL